MILECPACQARFMVADAQIPEGGRVVRCGRCANEWHTLSPVISVDTRRDADGNLGKPVDEAFLQQLEAALGNTTPGPHKPIPFGSNLPALKRPPHSMKPYKIAVPALAALWLVTAFITYFPSWAELPILSGIYHAIGAKTVDGLVFSDVTMEREQEGNKARFILSGSISNHSNATRAVPTVRVSLRNKQDKAIWGREYPVNTELKAGEVYPFRITNVETAFASSVSSIVVDMGNSLQLLVR
ncbi:MAG: DUF3426 domain-containing protein [Rickettsiales bacterium]